MSLILQGFGYCPLKMRNTLYCCEVMFSFLKKMTIKQRSTLKFGNTKDKLFLFIFRPNLNVSKFEKPVVLI